MSTHPVSNFPEAEFRFSRAARRCSCSSSRRRYSCSNTRLLRSHSRCCSSDQGHGLWDFPPFHLTQSSLRLAFYLMAFGGGDFCESPPLYAFHSNASSFSISPKKQSRPPRLVLEYEEALLVPEYTTPAYAYAVWDERPRTRPVAAFDD